MSNKTRNIVLELNALQQGLNFLVTSEWWDDFIRQNMDIGVFKNIVIPAQHPLDILTEMGIIKFNQSAYQNQLVSLEVNAKKAAKTIANQVNHMLGTEQKKNQRERHNQLFQQWAFLDIEEPSRIDKILICPSVDFEMIKELFFETFQWKVVRPTLYQLICLRNSQMKGKTFNNQLIGIPIFLEKGDVSKHKNEMTYHLQRQIFANIYFYNNVGVKYSIIGAIQTKQSLPQTIQYFYNGLKKLVRNDRQQRRYKKNTISIYKNQVYSNFYDESQKQLAIKWNSYSKMPKNVFSQTFEFIQFSLDSHKFQPQSLEQVDNLSKKIKENEGNTSNKNTSRRRGFQPADTNSYYSPILKINSSNATIQPIIKQNNILIKPQTNNQYHSSTEQETPSALLKQHSNSFLHADFIKYYNQRKDENRIKYPVWANNMNVKSLLKFSELKTNDYITVPFTNTKRLMVKSRNNKRIFLSGRCNRIHQNDSGQQIQHEARQQQPQIFNIPTETIKMLQNLAVEIVANKNKIHTEKLLKKQDILEPAKEKADLESQTCKNQDIEDLDSFQGHQF